MEDTHLIDLTLHQEVLGRKAIERTIEIHQKKANELTLQKKEIVRELSTAQRSIFQHTFLVDKYKKQIYSLDALIEPLELVCKAYNSLLLGLDFLEKKEDEYNNQFVYKLDRE